MTELAARRSVAGGRQSWARIFGRVVWISEATRRLPSGQMESRNLTLGSVNPVAAARNGRTTTERGYAPSFVAVGVFTSCPPIRGGTSFRNESSTETEIALPATPVPTLPKRPTHRPSWFNTGSAVRGDRGAVEHRGAPFEPGILEMQGKQTYTVSAADVRGESCQGHETMDLRFAGAPVPYV